MSSYFGDLDDSDALTYSATGLPDGLSIDPVTGVISGTIAPNASEGGPYTVVITATDESGASVSQSFTWDMDNPPPVAVDDTFSASQNDSSPIVGNVLGNDYDPNGSALTVVPASGVAGSNGGTFSISEDGTVSFDKGSDFDDLVLGQSRTSSFTYTVMDAGGATSEATVTVTVFGLATPPAPVRCIVVSPSLPPSLYRAYLPFVGKAAPPQVKVVYVPVCQPVKAVKAPGKKKAPYNRPINYVPQIMGQMVMFPYGIGYGQYGSNAMLNYAWICGRP